MCIRDRGKRHHSNHFHLEPLDEPWTSTRTFNDYPVSWKLDAPDFKLSFEAHAAFPNQEFATALSKPAFWEGRMNITGKYKGKKVEGVGYIERHGFVNNLNMKDFLKSVSKQTLKSVRKIIPTSFGQDKFEELVSVKGNKHYTDGPVSYTHLCQYKGHKEYISDVPCLPAGRFVLNFVCFVLNCISFS